MVNKNMGYLAGGYQVGALISTKTCREKHKMIGFQLEFIYYNCRYSEK